MADFRADFRSDTVTVPAEGMKKAMFEALVGDSVYGEDPTEAELERRVAELAGKEAALFVCTGVMSNQVALRVHSHSCKALYPEVLFARDAHVGFRELGGPVFNSRVMPTEVPWEGHHITVEDFERRVNLSHDLHSCTTNGICLENTMSGQVIPLQQVRLVSDLCKKNGFFLHMDGARLWNAVVKTGIPLREWTSLCDSVSLCFSKGLGAPVGSVLVGSKTFIASAREVRKAMGGGWRQCGSLAAACLYALDNNVDRLAQDHENASAFAKGMTDLGFECTTPDTNIFYADCSKLGLNWDKDFVPHLQNEGIRVAGGSNRVRFVTHLQTPKASIEKTLQVLQAIIRRVK